MTAPPGIGDHIEAALEAARRHGADHADAVFIRNEAESATVRRGVPEDIERSETVSLGLRVFRGQRAAIVSTSVMDAQTFDRLAEQACAMAAVVPEDRYGGLAPGAAQGMFDAAGLELADTARPDMDALLVRAKAAEDAALGVAGITNSGGASASFSHSEIALGTSAGFLGRYARTRYSTGLSVLAGEGASMQRDHAGRGTAFLADLLAPDAIGQEAAERTLRRLNPVKPKTGFYDIVFDPRVSSSLLGHLAAAINGATIARGTSFLRNDFGRSIFGADITIIDDPTRRRGAASRPFDAEGCPAERLSLLDRGVLTSWLLDSRSARQLGLTSNGRASRGVASPPSPAATNLHLEPGPLAPEALRADIREGILVTELMGSSINMLTGDYSRGASGFMIRDGEIAEPLAEMTIAGNLRDMFTRMHPANDLEFRSAVNAPSIRIDHMNVAGN